MRITVSDWKSYEGTGGLRGFFKMILDCGLVVRCSVFEQDSGARWIGFPTKQWTKRNGQTAYEDQVDYIDQETEERFHAEVFAQLDKIRNAGKSEEPVTEEGIQPAAVITNEDIPF